MTLEKRIKEEYLQVKNKFQNLGSPKKEKYGYSINGRLDLIDPFNSKLWESYQIRIDIPYEYPVRVPTTYELSKKIDRNDDNHIDSNGKCCLAPRLEELLILGKNYTLVDYIDKLVMPFLASHKLKQLGENKGIGEYSHFGSGLIEYYKEKFQTPDIKSILESLHILSNIKQNKRNEKCFCGSGKKYKRCHLKTFYDYQIIDRKIFLEDLRDIEKTLEKESKSLNKS